jgi:hypothetical protein
LGWSGNPEVEGDGEADCECDCDGADDVLDGLADGAGWAVRLAQSDRN